MSVSARPTHVVVVGGGISGLAAAWFLLDQPVAQRPRVTVVESAARVGGKLYADEIAGVPVDLGAESMLAARPEGVGLAKAVGLADEIESPATANSLLWTRGALRPMPRGQVMGVPGSLTPIAASGVLSPAGLARIQLDRVLPRTQILDDVSVGGYVAARLGREVVDHLVEPLLGGVYAGDVYQISMRAAAPMLFGVAQRSRSLLKGVRELQRRAAARRPRGPRAPVFMGVRGGVGRLALATADACRSAGARLELGTTVRELRRAARDRWQLVVDTRAGRRTMDADAVVLAVPARPAADLLNAESPLAAAELSAVEYASMALVTMAFHRHDVAGMPESSGFLVPAVDTHVIKAATLASQKWGWIDQAGKDTYVLRTSIGRYGQEEYLAREDTDLVRLARDDLRRAVGLTAAPVAARVTRWDCGLPQYPVGHVDRVARIREHVAKLPGLAVCGAVYDGVGVPACVGSARRAVDKLAADAAEHKSPGAKKTT